MADFKPPRRAGSHGVSEPAASPPGIDPVVVMRSKAYLPALVLAAVLGVPTSAIAYGFLALVAAVQRFVSDGLPNRVLGGSASAWWPVPWLVLCGLLTASTIRYLIMGVAGALLGWLIRWVGLSLRPIVHLNRVLVTSALGLLIGLTAMAYQLISGHSFTQVLFSGQDALPALVEHAADYSLAVLVLLIACKTFVYGLSLSAFRGGPVFPSMFIGAALGIADHDN